MLASLTFFLLILSAALMIGLGVLAWRFRAGAGTRAYLVLMAALSLWAVGYALELNAETLAQKLFWAKVQYLGIVVAPTAWLLFIQVYLYPYRPVPRWLLGLLALEPLAILVLAWSNELHGWIWQTLSLNVQDRTRILVSEHGPAFWIHVVYSYALLFVATLQLAWEVLRPSSLYRSQTLAFFLAALAPWLGNALYLTGLTPQGLDLTPLFFSFTGLLSGWALFRSRFFSLLPIAQETIFRQLPDPLLVLTPEGRVSLANAAAVRVFGGAPEQVHGRALADLHPALGRLNAGLGKGQVQAEIALEREGRQLWFEVRAFPLRARGISLGTLLLLHEITARKRAEEEREQLLVAEREQRLLAETLREVTLALTSQTRLEDVLDEILRQAERLVPYTMAHIALVTDGHLRVARWRGERAAAFFSSEEARLQALDAFPLDAEVIRRGRPLWVPDTRSEPRWRWVQGTEWIRSHLTIPIRLGPRILGLLRLDSEEPERFSLADVARLEPLADAAAVALQNAQLLAVERRRTKELEAIRRAALNLTASLDLPRVLQAILEETLNLVDADDAHIFLYDGHELHFGAALGRTGPLSEPYSEPRRDGLTYTVARTGRRMVIPNVNEHPLYQDWPWGGAIAGFPLRVGGQVRGVMNVAFHKPHEFTEDEIRVLELLADHAAIALENARLFQETQKLAVIDELTGVYNRRGLFTFGRREIQRARRFGRPLSLLMLDIDDFKEVNDRHGHLVGDQVLKGLARLLQRRTREVDLVARYGGEEFAVLLPETGLEDARRAAERLRREVAETPFQTQAGPLYITVSFGVAEVGPPIRRMEDLLQAADRGLYRAKAAGKNRVEVERSEGLRGRAAEP